MANTSLGSIFNNRKPHNNSKSTLPSDHQLKPVDKSCLGYEQSLVFDAMEQTNTSMFITGKAGTGKSFLLRFFVENSHKKIVVLAPTGIAAINAGGQTIHSFFRIPPKAPLQRSDLQPDSRKRELYRCLDAIVIDEISMVRADIMNAIDYILRVANDTNQPFGGKQILMFGDLYQLPPVAQPQVKRYLDDTFGGIFFFNAPGFKNYQIKICELTHIFRQNDPTFIRILNEIRTGNINQNDLSLLNQRADIPMPTDNDKEGGIAVVIAPKKNTVERYNESMLASIDDPSFIYEADISGDFKETEFPALKRLELKVGAKVMMLVNDIGTTSDLPSENRRWANGTLGMISRLNHDSIWVMINGVSHQIDRHTWKKYQYSYDENRKQLSSRVTAEFTQFPVALAWAITVHKAQGATYQSVGIDMDQGMFAAGQAYVALSRCVDMNRLYLNQPMDREDIIISSEVQNFMSQTKNPSQD